jgi:hypothetical protein
MPEIARAARVEFAVQFMDFLLTATALHSRLNDIFWGGGVNVASRLEVPRPVGRLAYG